MTSIGRNSRRGALLWLFIVGSLFVVTVVGFGLPGEEQLALRPPHWGWTVSTILAIGVLLFVRRKSATPRRP